LRHSVEELITVKNFNVVILVANNEDSCCCNVCCLVEQGREMFVRRPNGSSSVSSDPGERYIRVPEHGVSNSSSYDMSATSTVSSPLQPNVAAAGSGYPSVFPVEVTSSMDTGEDSGEAYIRLEDCYSGQPVSSVPVYSAARGRPTLPANKGCKQMRASAPVNVDATNHFGDGAFHTAEYCNEYERGEHASLFIDSSNYTSNVDGDDSDSNNNEDYSHYQYPVVHYSTCHSVLPQLGKSGSIRERYYREPDYVNCSYLWSNLHHSGRRVLCPAAKRYGICCESVLACPELSKSSGHGCTNSSASWSSKAAAAAAAADDDDDDDDDLQDYVNVPLLHYSHMSLLF